MISLRVFHVHKFVLVEGAIVSVEGECCTVINMAQRAFKDV